MFKEKILETPLTSRSADLYFPNITGNSFGDDCSLLATCRALVAPRMQEGDRLEIEFSRSSFSKQTVSSETPKDVVECLMGRTRVIEGHATFGIHNVASANPEDNDAVLDKVEAGFPECYPDWQRVQRVTDFFRKTFRVLCYINEDEKKVMMFVESLSYPRLHYIQCGLFAYFPWYFNTKDGVSSDEMALINSLRSKSSDGYIECLEKIASGLNLRENEIRVRLNGFETRYEQAQVSEEERTLRDLQARMDDLDERMSGVIRDMRIHQATLMGLQEKISGRDGDSELMEYFLSNKNIFLEDTDGDRICFSCRGYIEYYDPDEAEKYINNRGSYVYSNTGRFRRDDIKKLMTAVFIDEKIRVRVCAAYSFRTSGGCEGIGNHTFDASFNDCIPNPHIDKYTCLGDHRRMVNQMLANCDYIGALEQLMASCASLNLGDYPVMTEFMEQVCGTTNNQKNTRCFELPDGSVVTTAGAIEWLNNEEKEEE